MGVLKYLADKLYSNDKEVALAEDLTSNGDWNGTVLTGGDLTAVGIIGANPEATLYPDGTIIGGSDNGKFTKWANGTLECTAIVIMAVQSFNNARRGVTFTHPFIDDDYHLSCTVKGASAIAGVSKLVFNDSSFSTTGTMIHAVTGNDSTIGDGNFNVSYKVTGRWK